MRSVARHPLSLFAICTLGLLTLVGVGRGGSNARAREEAGPWPAYLVHISAPVRAGKSQEARDLILRMSNYLGVNHPKIDVLQLTNWGPLTEQVTWLHAFADTAAVERFYTQISLEEGWLALHMESLEIFEIENSRILSLLPVVAATEPHTPGLLWSKRIARTSPDRLARALRFARAEAEFINAAHPNARMQVFSATEENLGTVVSFGQFTSSDEWRKIQTALWSNPDYLELMKDAEGLFDLGWEESLESYFVR